MVGAMRLVGRGLGLDGLSDEADEGERMAWTEEGREVDPALDWDRATGGLTRVIKKIKFMISSHK
jgi:hypothetical protein